MTYLVNVATQSIEISRAAWMHRPGTFPNHELEHFRTFWASFAAALTVAAAAFLLLRAFAPKRRKLHTVALVVTSAILLCAAASYCVWFNRSELPRIAPDMVGVGVSSGPFDWLGGALIACIAISAASHRLSAVNDSTTVESLQSPGHDSRFAFHESPICWICLLAAAFLYFFGIIRLMAGPMGSQSIAEAAVMTLHDLESYLVIAIAALSAQLCWIRWRRRNDTIEWKLHGLNRARYVWSWTALAVLTAVAIPTMTIYSVTFWMGPWYKLGPQ